jgi:tRNA dimethylallyltransferase
VNEKPTITIHIVAGPTASGKTAKAIEIARAENGIVINCDSMQIYDGLALLTAQPDTQERSEAEHKLYGVLHPDEICSAGSWREMVLPLIEETIDAGKTPIICGGNGMYIKALMDGLSPIPQVPDEIRQQAIQKQIELGNPAFHAELMKRDPASAERFHPSHTARLVRAWEVLEATGKSLTEWQKETRSGPPEHWEFEIHTIIPEREILRARCDARFLKMMECGAVDEVKEFSQKIENGEINAETPLTKALGYKPLLGFIKGKISKEEAIDQAQTETRQYAKRQVTWFKNQL